MLMEYIQEALKRARYEMIEDEEPYYGEIPELPGVWATGKTLEECRENLREAVEGWIIVRLQKGLPLPPLGKVKFKSLVRSWQSGNLTERSFVELVLIVALFTVAFHSIFYGVVRYRYPIDALLLVAVGRWMKTS